MSTPQRQALGRGLSALLDAYPLQEKESLSWLDPSVIVPNRLQPRMHFDEESLVNLTQSIKENGVLQPLLVQKTADDQYELIAGERRWRASQRAGLTSIPCRVMSFDEKSMLEVALLENIQRDDLNVLEEAQGYQLLLQRFSYTQEDLAQKLGKSRSHIANRLRLLSLPEDLKVMIKEEKISAGHAKALLSTEDPSALARKVIDEKLSVRSTEHHAKSKKEKSSGTALEETAELSAQLSHLVGHDVVVHIDAKGKSTLTVSLPSVQELEIFIEHMHRGFTGGA